MTVCIARLGWLDIDLAVAFFRLIDWLTGC